MSTVSQTNTKMSFTMKNTLKELKAACKERGLKVIGKKATLLAYLTGEMDGRRKKKKKISHIMGRVSTMVCACMRDYCNRILDVNQPIFTSQDQEMKEKLFNFKGKTSFLSGEKCGGVGDHIYGIREGFRAGYDWAGSNTKWNTIPVTHAENVTYKSVVVGGAKKNLVYDEFTQEEQSEFNEEQNKIYTSIKAWEKYVESRGAHMYWDNQRENDEKFKAAAVEMCAAFESFVLNKH